jgi:hypothetical protein
MSYPTQPGITPPAPGLDKEEPELWNEADIPSDGDDEDVQGDDRLAPT